jgi:phosphatidylglycerol lysyltransferase
MADVVEDAEFPSGRSLIQRAIRIGIPLLVVAIGLVVLHGVAREIRWSEVRTAVAATPTTSILAAALATAVGLVAVSLYDVLALRGVQGHRVPPHVAALTGATSFAISNLLGFAWLTSTTVRYRIYETFALTPGQIAQIVATCWSAQVCGVAFLSGALLALHPVGLSGILSINPWVETLLGVAILTCLAAGLLWLARKPRDIRIGGAHLALPSPTLALPLIGIALLDILCASLVLYALLPDDLTTNFALFFTVFVASISLGLLSNAPGGLGVFEATMLVGLGSTGRPEVLASLLLYRLIYTVAPFILAALGLVLAWLTTQRPARRAALVTQTLMRAVAPMIAAGAALLSGMTLLLSGSLPLRSGLPGTEFSLPFFEASHLIGSIAGALLIVLMRGLYHKLFRAWLVVMVLLAVSLVAALIKGPDWGQTAALLASLAFLGLFRSSFYREDGRSIFRLDSLWTISIVALLGAVFWVGMLAHRHVAYRDDLWWEFAWSGDASRFLRASLGAAVVILLLAANALITRRRPLNNAQPIPQAVRDLLARCSDPDAQIALTGDKAFLVSPDQRAFLAYADTGNSLIANGDPVGDPASGIALIWQLREMADKTGRRCAFYGVSPAYLPTYLDLGLQVLKIGEAARVPLKDFTLDGPLRKDLRYAVGRAARDGFAFEIIPAAEIPQHFAALRRVSDAWLLAKQGQEKAFVMGACEESYLMNFDHAVLRQTATGTIVAFANLLQGADQHDLSVDLIRHDPSGPKIAMDALFGNLLIWAKARGFQWFSLGAAPLAGLPDHRLASRWTRIARFIYAHGEHFYHFEGLRAFKQKFDPVWTPHYLAIPRGLSLPRILYEVNSLISGGMIGVLRKR